ncbi:MAG: hypothetical protein RML45_02285 [Acetobacteraceae bacterium]|nr:hypothetical protein [Acetobacteraceae bacterium]
MRGLFRVDRARVDALNAIDEAITLATLPDDTAVEAGEMVATVKIIPFAVAAFRARAGRGRGARRGVDARRCIRSAPVPSASC